MRTIVCSIALCFAIFDTTVSASDKNLAQYPELRAARNLVKVANAAVDRLARKYNLPTEHKAAALRFIFSYEPVRDFEQLMVSDAPTLRRGHIERSFRKSFEYRRDYDSCDVVSESMAKLFVRDAVRIYERRFLHPDRMTRDLFAANPAKAEQTSISGIIRKVAPSQFKKEMNSEAQMQPGDKIYFYAAFNRTGYLIVGNNKVVKDEVSAVF